MSNNRLRELRTERGLVQAALAVKAGVSPGTIGLIERWDYPASMTIRQRVAAALECEESDIWPPDTATVA